MMRCRALACDYDGTLAREGRASLEALDALRALRGSGRKLILVTGRRLADLLAVLDPIDLFDRIVAENGAVLYRPSSREERTLADPPPPELIATLASRRITPLESGRVILATVRPHETAVLAAIRDLGLELQVIFNRGAVMVLPSGINKGTGLRAALEELGLSVHNVVGVGDAENDHGFLDLCECAVAVADALPSVRQRAHLVTAGESTRGVTELAARIMADDLSGIGRRELTLGDALDGSPVTIAAHGESFLIAGTSGAGKSTLATGFLEQLQELGYQFCIIDPEGDFHASALATPIGSAERPPTVQEVAELLDRPAQSLVVNLLGVGLEDRPAFFGQLLTALLELRARASRPHWLVIDEAHHLLPRDPAAADLHLPRVFQGVLMITVHPEHVSPAALAAVDVVVAVGKSPRQTLAGFAQAGEIPAPPVPVDDLPAGEGFVWRPRTGAGLVRFRSVVPRAERRRHRRKYAEGELGPDRSFYFRGPDAKLNLRAQNLRIFLQVADGVDEATWRHHFENGDIVRWFRDAIKDPELADQVARLARQSMPTSEARRRVRALVEEHYTEAP
jgi:hydroxymethylpyrimidine pyrophosphatase-like HAD family hydrolase